MNRSIRIPFTRCAMIIFFSVLSPVLAGDFQDHPIVVEKELLITDPLVVDSKMATYPGAWSFGYLLEQACSHEQAPSKVAVWLESWAAGAMREDNKVISIGERAGLRDAIIKPWQKRDGYREDAGVPWSPNFSHAPFRLLAIVNRMDLALPAPEPVIEPRRAAGCFIGGGPRGGGYMGGPTIASREHGEARLIFCLVDEKGLPVEKGLTLIFEYGLDGASRLDWALAWHSLGKHSNFDQGYLDELEKVTRCFTDRGFGSPDTSVVKDPEKNEAKSAVDQLAELRVKDRIQLLRVRSNDGIGGALREFREFVFDEKGLTPVLLKSSPKEEMFDTKNSGNRQLTRWLENDAKQAQFEWQKAIRLNKNPTFFPQLRPVTLPETIFVSREQLSVVGFASVVKDEKTHWDGWGMGNDALRRDISMQSCCGCHCGDTNTKFYHIAPRAEGAKAVISQFLRTDGSSWSLKDPASLKSMRSHEMEDRERFFASILDPNMSVLEKRKIRESRQLLDH